MRKFWSVFFFVMFFFLGLEFTANAHIHRWILINPQKEKINSIQRQMKLNLIKSQFLIGRDHIVVIDFPPESTDKKIKFFLEVIKADKIQPDFAIGLVDQPANDLTNWPQTKTKKQYLDIQVRWAWHLERLSFSFLSSSHAGQGVVVAILDTGVDYSHDHLKANMWVNQKEIPNNQMDDDHNGYVDDQYGYNFVENDADPMDSQVHGTHVAGLVSAKSFGVGAGIAPEAKLMALRMVDRPSTSFLSDAARAIVYAVDNGANIICNSWRVYKTWQEYQPSPENLFILKRAIQYAFDHQVLFVVAAGNETLNLNDPYNEVYPIFFNDLENMIVVAASDETDHPTIFTNYGNKYVHVVAPGNHILSTVPKNSWRQMSGTSMAAPLVAGLLARGLSIGGMDPLWLRSRLFSTSTRTSAFDERIAFGIINPILFLND